jgi:hypothetical protein
MLNLIITFLKFYLIYFLPLGLFFPIKSCLPHEMPSRSCRFSSRRGCFGIINNIYDHTLCSYDFLNYLTIIDITRLLTYFIILFFQSGIRMVEFFIADLEGWSINLTIDAAIKCFTFNYSISTNDIFEILWESENYQ